MPLTRENGPNPLGWKGSGPFMLRTVGDQPTLWEAILPEELRRLPEELARLDVLLDDPVFVAPPWPEIYATDPERRHGLADAMAEHDRILQGLADLGHRVIVLPKVPVLERRDFVLEALD